jgi:tetratricopeptide (TPR) repeat protein
MACSSLAQLETLRRNTPSAEALYKEAIQLEPRNDVNYFFLGLVYKDQGDYEKARRYIAESLRLLESSAPSEYRASVEAKLRECEERAAH